MKSMELTKEESKAGYGEVLAGAGDAPLYPYGLNIHLDNETIKKLGLTGLPDVGQVMNINAVAKVVSIGTSQHQGNDKTSRAELQITHMTLDKAGKDMAKEMYPDMD